MKRRGEMPKGVNVRSHVLEGGAKILKGVTVRCHSPKKAFPPYGIM